MRDAPTIEVANIRKERLQPFNTGWRGLALYAVLSFAVTIVLELVIAPVGFLLTEPLSRHVEFYRDLAQELANGRLSAYLFVGIPALVIVLLQVLFLLPVFCPPEASARPRGMRHSVLTATFMGALIAAAVAMTVVELLSGDEYAVELFGSMALWVIFAAALVPTWILWSIVLLRSAKRCDPVAIDRLMLPLLTRTAIGIAITLPIDALVRRKKDCYCNTGSFWGLMLAIAALLWLVGPFVVLAFSRQRRLALRRRACLVCGYGRHAKAGLRCSECGETFSRKRAASSTSRYSDVPKG